MAASGLAWRDQRIRRSGHAYTVPCTVRPLPYYAGNLVLGVLRAQGSMTVHLAQCS
jgi:hypothetical protein